MCALDNEYKFNENYAKFPVNTRLVTQDIFNEMKKKDEYYENRWEYVEDIRIELLKLTDFFLINSLSILNDKLTE